MKLTLSSMKGEWIPTRFNTGGVKVFFSVRSLGSSKLEHEWDISMNQIYDFTW